MDIVSAKRILEKRLFRVEGVVGVGANVDRGFIVVYVEDLSVCSDMPKEFEGYEVKCVEVGRVEM